MVISASLQACGVVFPFAMLTSICRSIVTICSGLYLLIGMTRFSSKWILSHSTWYKLSRSRHPVNESFGLYVIVLVCVAAPKNWPKFPSFVENAATVVVVVTVTVPSLFVVDVVEVLTARLALAELATSRIFCAESDIVQLAL